MNPHASQEPSLSGLDCVVARRRPDAADWITGVVWSGLILSIGGLAGVIAGPVAGVLCDRTASRWGRRRPWAIGGSVLTSASLLLTGAADDPVAVGGAWIGVSVGVAVVSAALTAMIADQVVVQRAMASALVSSAQAVGIVVYTVFVVAASVIAGAVSDRTGVRRAIVVVAALIQAASAVMILISPTFIGTAIAAAVMGIGYGAFMSVRLALATDLLPHAEHNARDLGIVNVSVNLGQLLGPLLGAGLVAWVGGFWLLFLAAGILSALGALMTLGARHSASSPAPDPAER